MGPILNGKFSLLSLYLTFFHFLFTNHFSIAHFSILLSFQSPILNFVIPPQSRSRLNEKLHRSLEQSYVILQVWKNYWPAFNHLPTKNEQRAVMFQKGKNKKRQPGTTQNLWSQWLLRLIFAALEFSFLVHVWDKEVSCWSRDEMSGIFEVKPLPLAISNGVPGKFLFPGPMRSLYHMHFKYSCHQSHLYQLYILFIM